MILLMEDIVGVLVSVSLYSVLFPLDEFDAGSLSVTVESVKQVPKNHIMYTVFVDK